MGAINKRSHQLFAQEILSTFILLPFPFYEERCRRQYEQECAYLVKEGDHYRLVFKHTKDAVYEGIFFKEVGTDFNNGVFKFMKGKEMLQVQVSDDLVKDFKNIEINPDLDYENMD